MLLSNRVGALIKDVRYRTDHREKTGGTNSVTTSIDRESCHIVIFFFVLGLLPLEAQVCYNLVIFSQQQVLLLVLSVQKNMQDNTCDACLLAGDYLLAH